MWMWQQMLRGGGALRTSSGQLRCRPEGDLGRNRLSALMPSSSGAGVQQARASSTQPPQQQQQRAEREQVPLTVEQQRQPTYDEAPARPGSTVSRFLLRPYASSGATLGVSAAALAALHASSGQLLVDPSLGGARVAAAAAAVDLLWAGAALAIANEAWLKFHAPLASRRVALDVGRHIFSALGKAELGLASVSVYLFWVGGGLGAAAGGAGVFAGSGAAVLQLLPPAIVALQAAWLSPALMARAQVVAEGGKPPPGGVHVAYGAAEAAKLALLLASSWGGLSYLVQQAV